MTPCRGRRGVLGHACHLRPFWCQNALPRGPRRTWRTRPAHFLPDADQTLSPVTLANRISSPCRVPTGPGPRDLDGFNLPTYPSSDVPRNQRTRPPVPWRFPVSSPRLWRTSSSDVPRPAGLGPVTVAAQITPPCRERPDLEPVTWADPHLRYVRIHQRGGTGTSRSVAEKMGTRHVRITNVAVRAMVDMTHLGTQPVSQVCGKGYGGQRHPWPGGHVACQIHLSSGTRVPRP